MSAHSLTPPPNPRETGTFYVAPVQAPAARRPPVRTVGIVGWLRVNLFATPVDSVITLITLGIVGALALTFLNWALFEAQWEVVFNNLRVFNAGQQFPPSAVWRVQMIGMIVVFLGVLSVGVWGRLLRSFVIILGIIAALMLIVPFLAQFAAKPNVYTYVDTTYAIRQVNFVVQAGQALTFTLDPLTTVDDFRLETLTGYVENDNQQANTAFDSYTSASTEVVFTSQRDPSVYDLNAAIQIWDSAGGIIAESAYSAGSSESTVLAWTAPAAGWYTYTAVRDAVKPGKAGSAWLRVDNLEVFRSTVSARQEREGLYGTPPELDCTGCATQANRTDMRYQGRRTLEQWFSLQLTPLLLETRPLYFVALVVGALAYGLGQLAKRGQLKWLNVGARETRLLGGFAGVMFGVYMLLQLLGIRGGGAEASTLYLGVLLILCAAVAVYALALLTQGTAGANARALGLLWAIAFPLILTLANGVAGVDNLALIPTDKQGGLLLTLLLSAVAIVLSFPIGLVLALGRQSSLPVVSTFCTVLIEVVRGVPLITLLFAGYLILPFFGLGLGDVDLVLRIMVVLTLFSSAYMAEVIRGGLQVVPKGQLEAAHALGLSDANTNALIVIPQALRAVIPAMMGQAVSLFKDTSLVYVIGLFELVGVTQQLLGDSQTGYLSFPREAYLFVGIVFFIFSYLMAEASRRLEKTGAGAVRRDMM
ncbi:MAG: amino acid ABC transporter permease [Armatimonadetes bacterium]|nr:amino acid ABC transporter permease [Anaerolineae bacterium]